MSQGSYWGDPLDCFDRYEADQSEELEKLPVCSECGEPIQDDFCYQIDGDLICEKCMDRFHVSTDRFINDGEAS